MFNRVMLPSYYGLLYLACKASRTFTRQLAAHQNLQWAFKNITPYPHHYPQVNRPWPARRPPAPLGKAHQKAVGPLSLVVVCDVLLLL